MELFTIKILEFEFRKEQERNVFVQAFSFFIKGRHTSNHKGNIWFISL